MRRALITGIASLFVAALVAPTAQAATAHPPKKNPKMKVVKAFGSAGAAADIASATATCPKNPTGRTWGRGERSAAVSK